MIRPLRVVTIIAILAVGVARSGAQPPPAPPSSQAALEEAKQLNQQVEKLYGEGKFQGAVAPAERALALREMVLGPMHPDVATSLNDLAIVYQAQAAYDKAEPLLTRALNIREKVLGSTHPDVAVSLNNLAGLYKTQGAYDKAESLYFRGLKIQEQASGPMHPNVAQILNNLAELYRARGMYGKAEPLLVRAFKIREKTLGPTHPNVAHSQNNLASLYSAQGKYEKAEPLLIRAIELLKKTLGPLHPDVVASLNNLAILYQDQGAYGKAEPLFVRALDIREKTLGRMHPDVAVSLNNLAALYSDQGAYEKAEPLFVRALDIKEKAVGPRHPEVATSLNNLANLYLILGAYGKAEPLFIRALDIKEKALGPRHPDMAVSLNNLAGVYRAQGAYRKAEPLLVRALDIRENTLGPMHPDVATSLNNLALIYQAQREYEKAEPLMVRALDISEKRLGPTHRDVASNLNNLATLYRDQGAYSKAELLLARALGIREKALGPMHPHVAVALNNLAEIYRIQGAHHKAEPLLVRALDIREKALGPIHPEVASTLNNLATLYWAQGSHRRVESLSSRVAEIRERQLRVELARLPESRKRALMILLQGETDSLVSLHADVMPTSGSAVELALTTALRRKGRILDSLAENEATLRAHLTPPLRDQLDQLTRARAELVARWYAPAGPRNAADRRSIAAARARVDDLESKLSAASAEFRAEAEPVTVAKVQSALPPGKALVEFVRYQRFDPQHGPKPWQEDRYVAYLLTRHGPPRWVALGEAARIDAEVEVTLATINGNVATELAKAALRRLDALVFAPIRTRLPSVSHVILAPDGELNLVPFEALVDSQGHYALENYLVSYVTTGRDLLRFAAPHSPRSPAVILAGPDYGPLPSSRVPGAVSFPPLRGAAAEATDLQRYFPTPALTGEKAIKSALAALTGPAMLHIATHGFYARDPATQPGSAALPTTSARGVPSWTPRWATHPWDLGRGMFVAPGASRSEDPADALDRAGLAMAGANQGPSGIVTAREIAGFDWWGTQLVVLSACETGVGAVPSGDGVYGLRRALVLAGAASQVVSLWSVSDASTRALMRDYYGELARGTGRAEALRRAKLRLLRQPRYAHAYYWAAFIPAGDWRPLDTTVFLPRKPQP